MIFCLYKLKKKWGSISLPGKCLLLDNLFFIYFRQIYSKWSIWTISLVLSWSSLLWDQLKTFWEGFSVKINCVFDNFLSVNSVFEGFDLDFFVLQFFVILKKSVNLLQQVTGKIINVIILVDWHIIKGNCDDLVIFFILIDHSHDSNNFGFNQAHGFDLNAANYEDIQGVLIVAVGLRNESVVSGIMNRTEKDSIQLQEAWFLIEFILDVWTDWDFDDGVDDLRSFGSVRDEMPRIFSEMLLHFSKIYIIWKTSVFIKTSTINMVTKKLLRHFQYYGFNTYFYPIHQHLHYWTDSLKIL